jgi:predicted RNA-binding Zn-ribbon protein involved in translation (DUF1610 family)
MSNILKCPACKYFCGSSSDFGIKQKFICLETFNPCIPNNKNISMGHENCITLYGCPECGNAFIDRRAILEEIKLKKVDKGE